MKYKFIIMFLFSAIIISNIALGVSQPIDVLNEFYQASIDKNIDKYISVQDSLFIEKFGDYKSYFENTFNEVDFINYEILNPEVFEKENRTLIFYELKGTFEIDGNKTDIDNDMVAFLWKYDDWKVRWTITRDLFEKKIQYAMIMDTSIEMLFEEASNKTIKQQMVDEGLDVTFDDETLDETSATFWPWIILLVLLAIFVYFYIKKPAIKKQTNNVLKKVYTWLKVVFIPITIKFLRWLWKWIVKICKLIFHHSKKAYKKAKPHVKKAYANVKPHVKKAYEKGKKKIININKNITKK